MFLTLFGEKLNGTDPEDVIKNAFGCFDADQTGTIKGDYLRELGSHYILCMIFQKKKKKNFPCYTLLTDQIL